MDVVEAVKEALPIFLQYRNLEDEDLLEVLMKKGFAPDTARKIVVFMPLAFGRIIMNDLGVETSDEFDVCEMNGSSLNKRRRKLKDVGIYREAFKIASQIAKDDEENFWAVAGRSAELGAVNQMKAQGVNPRNAVLTAMATMWEIDEEPPCNGAESIKTGVKEQNRTKNWWEFWK